MRQVGLLGGTFDPPHFGHLIAAEVVRDQLQLDEVRLVVANDPWQKSGQRTVTPPMQRLAMAEAAVRSEGSPAPSAATVQSAVSGSQISVSDIEVRIGGPSYMARTLERLVGEEPGVDWRVLVGADAALGLDSWNRADWLRSNARFVVVNRSTDETSRPGVTDGRTVPDGFVATSVRIPDVRISSSDLRQQVAAGRSIRFQSPDAVIAIIDRLGLYRRTP
jgi:nicotinate-nucleotide adenylyltransferase